MRETLRVLARHIEIGVHEVPTGTQVFDWTIPREWNIRDAYIKDARGEKIVDFAQSNLHVMSYSVPVRKHVSLAELKTHIYTLPEQPDLIPYRTSYYSENWGFCMAHRQFESLRDETYEVVINSSLEDGFLTYGEYLHEGETEDEFLLFGPRLSSLARQRQLLGAGAADISCQAAFARYERDTATAFSLHPAQSAR